MSISLRIIPFKRGFAVEKISEGGIVVADSAFTTRDEMLAFVKAFFGAEEEAKPGECGEVVDRLGLTTKWTYSCALPRGHPGCHLPLSELPQTEVCDSLHPSPTAGWRCTKPRGHQSWHGNSRSDRIWPLCSLSCGHDGEHNG